MAQSLGTRVHIERKEKGGKVSIDFFSNDDLRALVDFLNSKDKENSGVGLEGNRPTMSQSAQDEKIIIKESPVDDRSRDEKDDDIYSVTNFSI